jgi:hypothetical protein
MSQTNIDEHPRQSPRDEEDDGLTAVVRLDDFIRAHVPGALQTPLRQRINDLFVMRQASPERERAYQAVVDAARECKKQMDSAAVVLVVYPDAYGEAVISVTNALLALNALEGKERK